jgi:hypothetical protein
VALPLDQSAGARPVFLKALFSGRTCEDFACFADKKSQRKINLGAIPVQNYTGIAPNEKKKT